MSTNETPDTKTNGAGELADTPKPIEGSVNATEAELLQRQIENWTETARRHAINEEFWRTQAELLGYRADKLTVPTKSEMKTETKIITDIKESDLDRMINAGWEKWHAEFKGDLLHVVLTRPRPDDPQPQPQPAVEKAAAPPAEITIVDGNHQPIDDEPTEKTPERELLEAVMAHDVEDVIHGLNAAAIAYGLNSWVNWMPSGATR